MNSNQSQLNLATLQKAVSTAAAFRCRRRLQPGGGPGDKVFPPTYAGAVYAVEQRRLPGRDQPVTCVLLDSVQSQANRMELALQEAADNHLIEMPMIEVDFSPHGPTGDADRDKSEGRLLNAVGRVTSLQVPHRLADAILRDSQSDGVPFRRSEAGKSLDQANPLAATRIFQLCPSALLFGMWDSTGPKGGLGAKFERAIVSELVGFGAETGDLLRGVRRDPFEASRNIPIRKKDDNTWEVLDDPKAKGAVRPAAINHGSVPFPEQRDKKTDKNHYSGVTVEFGEQITTLSLIVLRRLRFPIDGKLSQEVDLAGRTVLAALGLCAATLAFEFGMGLRSRCLLWPETAMEWECLAKPGVDAEKYGLDSSSACGLLKEAVAAARDNGLTWRTEPLVLQPSKELLKLVRLSQEQAVKSGTEVEEE